MFVLFISIITYSGAALLQRVLMRDEDKNPLAYSAFTQLLSGVMVLVYAVLTQNLSFPTIEVIIQNKLYVFMLLSGVCFATNAYLSFKSLKYVDISKFIVLFSLRTVVTIFVASVFLKEGLNATQFIGAILILLSIVLINTKSIKEIFVFGKGELYVLLAAIVFGLGNANDKYILNSFELVPYMTIGFLLPGTLLLLSKPKTVLEFSEFFRNNRIWKILIFTFLYTVSALTFYNAFVLADNASLVSSIGQISTILVVILGVVFLKEYKDLRKKIIGGLLSFIGLILLTI